MTLTVAAVLQGTGGRVLRAGVHGGIEDNGLHLADLQRQIAAPAVDPGRVEADALFIDLGDPDRGVPEAAVQALARGAGAILLRETIDRGALAAVLGRYPGRYAFLVPSPLAALWSLARFWRQTQSADVVAIAGDPRAAGIVAAVLAPRGPLLLNDDVATSEIDVPLALLRLGDHHRTVVLTLDSDRPEGVERLTAVAQPRVGIVAGVHPGEVNAARGRARTASVLVAALPADGVAILNGDDPWTRVMSAVSGLARSVLVGLGEGCEYRVQNMRDDGPGGTVFTLHAPDATILAHAPAAAAHPIHPLLAAAAAARELGIDWPAIAHSLQFFRAVNPGHLPPSEGATWIGQERRTQACPG